MSGPLNGPKGEELQFSRSSVSARLRCRLDWRVAGRKGPTDKACAGVKRCYPLASSLPSPASGGAAPRHRQICAPQPLSPFDASSLVAWSLVTPSPPSHQVRVVTRTAGIWTMQAPCRASRAHSSCARLCLCRIFNTTFPSEAHGRFSQGRDSPHPRLVSSLIDFGTAWLVPSDLSTLPFSRRPSFTRRSP